MENAPSRNFYHSFPRRRSFEPRAADITKGLNLLEAIKRLGIVLAPEVVEWSIPQIDGTTKVIRNRQIRICFTELSRPELARHAETFGPFSLEFPVEVLRQFGVLPVIYVPQMVGGDRLLSSLGPVIVWMFENARFTLDKLDQLSKLSDPKTALELIRKTNPEATSVDPNFMFHLQNHDEGKNIVKSFDVKASVVRGILDYLSYRTAPFDLMRGAIYAAQNLFYPTDGQFDGEALSYYRQREWRIIPGVSFNGKSNARAANSDEKEFLLGFDGNFWSRDLVDDKGSFRRIDEAHVIEEFNGKHISEFVKKVIVPPEAYAQARELFAERTEVLDNVTLSNP